MSTCIVRIGDSEKQISKDIFTSFLMQFTKDGVEGYNNKLSQLSQYNNITDANEIIRETLEGVYDNEIKDMLNRFLSMSLPIKFNFSDEEGKLVDSEYNEATGEITIYTRNIAHGHNYKQLLYKTIAKEIVVATVTKGVNDLYRNRGSKELKNISKLYESYLQEYKDNPDYKRFLELRGMYNSGYINNKSEFSIELGMLERKFKGLVDLKSFIKEGLVNTTFRNDLKSKNLWESFKEFISNILELLGIKTKPNDFDVLDYNYTQLLENTKKLFSHVSQVPVGENNPENFYLHSGGARGADTEWGNVAMTFGIPQENILHYKTGTMTNGNTEISERDRLEGSKRMYRAGQRMFGLQRDDELVTDDRLIRNWAQVKYSDAVFAVGTIAAIGDLAFPNQQGDTRVAINPTVTGGTGYAVNSAILNNKPVYVFNQTKNSYEVGWYQYDKESNDFIPVETPTLTPEFAGIGTREINDAGKKAIQEVFEKTFNKKVEEETDSSIKVEQQNRYSVQDVRNNPDKIFVFGDNSIGQGTGGQAQIRNEPNTAGIMTKKFPRNTPDAFLYDSEYEDNIKRINEDINNLKERAKGKTIVFPTDGIGTNLADMAHTAPKTMRFLIDRLMEEFGIKESSPFIVSMQNKLKEAEEGYGQKYLIDGKIYSYNNKTGKIYHHEFVGTGINAKQKATEIKDTKEKEKILNNINPQKKEDYGEEFQVDQFVFSYNPETGKFYQHFKTKNGEVKELTDEKQQNKTFLKYAEKYPDKIKTIKYPNTGNDYVYDAKRDKVISKSNGNTIVAKNIVDYVKKELETTPNTDTTITEETERVFEELDKYPVMTGLNLQAEANSRIGLEESVEVFRELYPNGIAALTSEQREEIIDPLEEAIENNVIINPFDNGKISYDIAIKRFIEWINNNKDFGNKKATKALRDKYMVILEGSPSDAKVFLYETFTDENGFSSEITYANAVSYLLQKHSKNKDDSGSSDSNAFKVGDKTYYFDDKTGIITYESSNEEYLPISDEEAPYIVSELYKQNKDFLGEGVLANRYYRYGNLIIDLQEGKLSDNPVANKALNSGGIPSESPLYTHPEKTQEIHNKTVQDLFREFEGVQLSTISNTLPEDYVLEGYHELKLLSDALGLKNIFLIPLSEVNTIYSKNSFGVPNIYRTYLEQKINFYNKRNEFSKEANAFIDRYFELFESNMLQQLGYKRRTEVKDSPYRKDKEGTFSYLGTTIDTGFNLNQSQREALKTLIDSVLFEKEPITLSGYAGSGKTTVIRFLENFFEEHDGNFNFTYATPTNSASITLSNSINANRENDRKVYTVSQLVYKDLKDGSMKFSNAFSNILGEKGHKVLVIDESSMLTAEQFKALSALKTIKIIFLGDKAQLPEVSNSDSRYESPVFSEIKNVSLNTVMRTSNKDLLAILQNIRDNPTEAIPYTDNTENVKFYDENEEKKGFYDAFLDSFLNSNDSTLLLSYKNETVQKMNKMVRKDILKSIHPNLDIDKADALYPGESIVGYAGFSSKKVEKGSLVNSVIYKVTDVKKEGSQIVITSENNKIKGRNRTYYAPLSFEGETFNFKNITKEDLESNNREISSLFKSLKEVRDKYFNAKGSVNIKVERDLKSDYLEELQKVGSYFAKHDLGAAYIYHDKLDRMVPYNPNELYRDKNGNPVKRTVTDSTGKQRQYDMKMSDYKSKNSDLYVEKGVDYGYAMTVHKSQGVTYDNVFYVAKDSQIARGVTYNKNNEIVGTDRNSLDYVALSRAAKSVHVLLDKNSSRKINLLEDIQKPCSLY